MHDPSHKNQKGKCVYCGRTNVVLTRSHIFTVSLGRGFMLPRAVCVQCQQRIRVVDDQVLDAFRLLRLLLGLKGRRGIPGLPAEVSFRGAKQRVTLGRGGQPPSDTVLFFDTKGGGLIFAGDKMTGARKKAEYESAHLDVKLERIPLQALLDKPKIDIDIRWKVFAGDAAKRFAAKVAFESYLRKCGLDMALADEFEEIKEFILYGSGPGKDLGGIFVDSSVEGLIGDLGFPNHFVFVQSLANNQLLAVVSLFSLLYYWIRLSKRHSGIESAICYVISPQTGIIKEPQLFAPSKAILTQLSPSLNWRAFKSWDKKEKPSVAIDLAIDRLNDVIRQDLKRRAAAGS